MQLIAFGKGYPLRMLLNKQTLFRMKLLMTLLTAACVHATATGFTQAIDVKVNNSLLQEVFRVIEKQTDFRFVYTTEQLQKLPPITLHVVNTDLDKVLQLCLAGLPLSYTIEDQLIIIHKKELPKMALFHDISGTVTNKDGLRLSGVNIQVKGSQRVTVTDQNGAFTLTNISPDAVLIVSSAEMETQEIRVNGKSFLAISLAQKVNELDETIVVGYGTTTRRFSTGSVTKVSAEEIAQQPVTNPLAALQGRVPGLVVTATSGLPGAAFKIQIRGQNSLNPDPSLNSSSPPLDNPLFIIDGVPFTPPNQAINQLQSLASPGNTRVYQNPYGNLSPFNNINPADIESIEVLRDASETAIYGSRGANGVVIITTKKGKGGRTSLAINVQSGANMVTRTMPMMDIEQYRAMREEAFRNDGVTPTAVPGSQRYAPDLLVYDAGKNSNWKEYFIGGTAQSTDVHATVSGGHASTQFLVGAGFHREGYIFPGDFNYSRGSINSNIRHASDNNKFNAEISLNYSYDQNNSSGSPSLLKAFTLPPNYPSLQDDEGRLLWYYNGVGLSDNPAAYLHQKYLTKNYNLVSNLQLSYRILPGLKFLSSLGYTTFNGHEQSLLPQSSQHPGSPKLSYANFGRTDLRTWLVEPQLIYNTKIGDGKLDVIAGGTYQKSSHQQLLIMASGFANELLMESVSAAENKSVFDNENTYKYAGVFARLNYIHNNRYIINVNGRRDGSSRFGPGKQFGNFGAIGAGWIFTAEPMIQKAIPMLTYGKLRGSFGTTGNDNIGNYEYLSRWASSSSRGLPFPGGSAFLPQNHYNPDFSWSVTRKMEAGLDLGFWKEKILLNITWFRHRSGNQLVNYRLASQTGFTGVTANFPALVQNKGWEISLSTTNIKRSKFSWATQFNISIPRNKLVDFPDIENSSYRFVYEIGQPLSVLKKFKLAGVNPNTGMYEFISKNGNTSSPQSSTDNFIIGSLDPKFYGGLQNSLRYRNLYLDVFFEFRKQTGANYLHQVYTNMPAGNLGNLPQTFNERWQQPGDQFFLQKLTSGSSTPAARAARNFVNSDAAYEDASYIRLKNVSLSYNLENSFLNKLKVRSLRIFLHAQNVLTITNYKGHDPETQSFYSLPPLKTIVAGILVNL